MKKQATRKRRRKKKRVAPTEAELNHHIGAEMSNAEMLAHEIHRER